MAYTEHFYHSFNSQGFHRIVYSDWGDADASPIIAVHGLTGNAHDFDDLARDLVNNGYRLIAVDLPGRGRSDFLTNPADYNYRQYCQDLVMLLNHLSLTDNQCVDWLGISLGGLLGIRLAGLAGTPIRRLILNDIGPAVPQDALAFIAGVLSKSYTFDTLQDLEQRLRETRGLSWGPVTDQQWEEMAEHNARALENGQITYAYDPEIAHIFTTEPVGELDLWPFWKNIKAPVLTLHGTQSIVLTDDIVQDMSAHYKGMTFDLRQFEDCGHVPSLMAPYQIEVIKQWLSDTPISS